MRYCAISITAREHAELVTVAAPGVLGPNEVRGSTLCTLISPGTELASHYKAKSFPTFPGYAAIFVVEELGAEVKGISMGDVCFCMGTHQSFQQVNALGTRLVPAGLSPEQAVLARLMGVSMTTLMTTEARPGDRVMVSGCGPVGYLAAQVFVHSGYDVLVVEPIGTRQRIAEQSGIRKVFPAVPVEDASFAGSIDLVIECSGHEQAVLDACRVVRKRGEVVLVGAPWQRQTEIYAQELLRLVFYRFVVLRSGWEWELDRYREDFHPHSIYSNFDTALRWLANGSIYTENLITRADPDNAQSAYQDLMNHRAPGLFTVFDWTKVASGA